jgi:uncharacterized protein (TIGR02271 family)
MRNELTTDRLAEMRGETVYDSAGEKIGKVDEIFYDNDTGQPEWLGIGTGVFSSKRVLVPVQGASTTGDGVTVAYDKEMVKDAPDISGDEIGEDTERELYSYYGIAASREHSDSLLPGQEGFTTQTRDASRPAAGGDAEAQAITRSEEELRVGKRSVEGGTARLRKWVETEPVQTNVTLERETVRVNREPVDQVVSGAEIGEQTIEVPLHDEEAVVDKQVVARERVSLDTDVEERTETVSDEVRKERVDIEGDNDRTSRDR